MKKHKSGFELLKAELHSYSNLRSRWKYMTNIKGLTTPCI